jgi:peptide/nickel transport system permease protein
MYRYVWRRALETVVLLFLVSAIIFCVIRLVPGDPAAMQMGTEATPEGLARLRHAMGLDRPIYVQYARWLEAVARGDLGVSWLSKQPALALIQHRVPATLLLTAGAALVGVAVAVPLGLLGGSHPGSIVDGVTSTFALLGVALPSFWLGLMLLLGFAMGLRWFPPSGYVPPGVDPGDALRHVTLPAVTLGIGLAAPLARFLRAGMMEALRQDYIRTALAKGVAGTRVVLRHALKNALLSVITAFALLFGGLLGGAIITESVFNWPGVGTLLLNAIEQRDYGVVQGVVLYVTLAFVVANFAADIVYTLLDPRIRYE